MVVVGFPTGSFRTNCYLVAPARGERCVIVDPGQDAAAAIGEAVREHHLSPAAVLVTHGHIDHVWSVLPVCGAHDVPAYVHRADRAQMADPTATLPADWVAGLGLAGVTFGEPDDVREVTDAMTLSVVARVCLTAPDDTVALPGHGPRTTIGQERATNPHLRNLARSA